MDGASLSKEIIYVLTPMAIPGIASTLLLNHHPAWNVSVLDLEPERRKGRAAHRVHRLHIRARRASSTAKLSGGLDDGDRPYPHPRWFSQKQLVRGLTFGAVK